MGAREGGAVDPANQWKDGGGGFTPGRFGGALPTEGLTGMCADQLSLPLAADRSVLRPSECGRRAFSS